jgi:hypothetical protein
MSDINNDARTAALKRERAGYLARGDEGRAALVDAELRRAGVEPDTSPDAEKPPVEDAKPQPRGRSGREQRQATADKPEDATG